jgi:P-type E1-E2 ATPase
MREMKAIGCRTVVLTGDRKEVGNAIAASLGVDEVDSELLPDEKVSRVLELRRQGRKVAMVGDGINDAPALVEANVASPWGPAPMSPAKAPPWFSWAMTCSASPRF